MDTVRKVIKPPGASGQYEADLASFERKARRFSMEAIEKIREIVLDPKAPANVKVQAFNSLVHNGFGTPAPRRPIEIKHLLEDVSIEELRALADELRARLAIGGGNADSADGGGDAPDGVSALH